MSVLAWVVAQDWQIDAKEKVPSVCEGLLKKAGIKNVCACVWQTVLVPVVGEDDCMRFGKRAPKGVGSIGGMVTQCVSAFIPGLCSEPYLK